MAGVRNPGLLAWLHLVRVFDKMHSHSMGHLTKYKLTPAQFDVLAHLSVAPGITQQELADKLLVTKGNICGLIDRLESQGLVERRCDPRDRRSNLLFLTGKAHELANEVIPAHEDHLQSHMDVLSEDEQRALLDLLKRLDHSLARHEH
jgi:DNA-binding MarR family transcriptional regulator